MTWAHFHLMTNHFPILGAPLVFALLAWGLWRRSREITRVALWSTVVLAGLSEAVFLTGSAAEEQIENRPGFNEELVDRHEERADIANIAMIITGAVAGLALWRNRREPPLTGVLPRVVLAALAVNTALYAVTAWTGGPISHPELRTSASALDAGKPLDAQD